MLARRIFVLLIATIVVARTLHCCYVEASLCARSIRSENAGTAPLRNPHDTDPNETGCICKGAIVDVAPVFTAVQTALEAFNPLAAAPESCALAISSVDSDGRLLDRHLLGPPPLGGKALRAWVGSLLI